MSTQQKKTIDGLMTTLELRNATLSELSDDVVSLREQLAAEGRGKNKAEAEVARLNKGMPLGEGIGPHGVTPTHCPTFYDGCNCTVETLESAITEIAARDATIAKYEGALEKLAVCGNGELCGNSIGNVIAQRALGLYHCYNMTLPKAYSVQPEAKHADNCESVLGDAPCSCYLAQPETKPANFHYDRDLEIKPACGTCGGVEFVPRPGAFETDTYPEDYECSAQTCEDWGICKGDKKIDCSTWMPCPDCEVKK